MLKRSAGALWIWSALYLGAAIPAASQAVEAVPVLRYQLHDVGTLGGSESLFYNFDQVNFTPSVLNIRGQLAGTSHTSDNFAAGYLWSDGTLHQLADFPNANVGGGGNNANGINDWGVVVGAADRGEINPLNGQPYDHAVFWSGSDIHPLPELDGHASWANFIDERGLIVGYANNAIPDPYTYAGTQTRAVIWRNGQLQDLGTLGGADSAAFLANSCPAWRDILGNRPRTMVVGTSSLNTPPGAPFGIPQTDAFLWADGVMEDLGGFGGGFSTPSSINCEGDIAVISFDSTNQYFQSFLWRRSSQGAGRRISLGRLGGNFVEAVALNDSSKIVGAVSDPSDAHSIAAIWGPDGEGRLLGTVGDDTGSIALDINSRGIVVGGSGTVSFTSTASYSHAFVRQGRGAIQDLNTLVPADAALTLNVAYAVNEVGEIAGLGTNATGETHAFVLTPDYTCHDSNFESAASFPAARGSSVKARSTIERMKRGSHPAIAPHWQ